MCCFGYFDPEVLTHNVVEHERFERGEQILHTNYKEIHYIWKTVWVLVFVSLVKSCYYSWPDHALMHMFIYTLDAYKTTGQLL